MTKPPAIGLLLGMVVWSGCGRGPGPEPAGSMSPGAAPAPSGARAAAAEGGGLVEVPRVGCVDKSLDESTLPEEWPLTQEDLAARKREDDTKRWLLLPRRVGIRENVLVVELLAFTKEPGRGTTVYEIHLDPALARGTKADVVAAIDRATATWRPHELAPLPRDPDAKKHVHSLNDICEDTYCESDFRFEFEDVTCTASDCTLSFSALRLDRRCIQKGTVDVPRSTFGDDEAFSRAVQPVLSRWIDSHVR